MTAAYPVSVSLIVDILCIAIAYAVVITFHFYGIPFERGFFCEDESIKYPYNDSTISAQALYLTFVGGPVVIIALCELKKRILCSSGHTRSYCFFVAFRIITAFLVGAGSTNAITDVLKYTIGRLRPHFISVCRPQFDRSALCGAYVTNYTCLGEGSANSTWWNSTNARLSFPSGHASISVYGAIFLILYFESSHHGRWPSYLTLSRPLVQLAVLAFALYNCATRVSDYKHHWSDVLAGAVLGAGVALFMGTRHAPTLSFRRRTGRLVGEDGEDESEDMVAMKSASLVNSDSQLV